MSDQSKSQTTEITVYEVFTPNNPISLTIIDTPGHGHTRGLEYDRKIAGNLYKLFHNETGVKEIDAVCLVVKATENRLSDRQQYIFDALLSLFGKDIEDNIVIFFFTYSDGLAPCNALNAIQKAAIPCRKDNDNEPVHFLFNNRQTDKRRKKYDGVLNTVWKNTENNLKYFFTSLKEQNRKGLEQTESVLFETKRLEACISNLQNRFEFVECKVKELTEIQEALQKNQEKIKQNENFTFRVTKHQKKFVPIENASRWDRKVTSCCVCKKNCHLHGCWFALDPSVCEVMDKNNCCTVCTGKCHFQKHVKERMKYVIETEELTMTFEELDREYEGRDESETKTKFNSEFFKNVREELKINKRQKEEKKSIVEKLQEDLSKAREEKAELVEEAYRTIMKLSEMALKTDSAFIIISNDRPSVHNPVNIFPTSTDVKATSVAELMATN
ncbi:hypothetical protein Baya_15158 [Bagarius yarrelli]|uniref:AIG1-type G domain-containing protein n=1 Tax=Bagarius yarrelli TaxID=175774 RepID=A0A556VAY7_BAGYA|nr:hypothetical protein Baya_15158 [Bagarius yarrelli]